MDFEEITSSIGGCHIYQYISFILLSIPTFKFGVDFQTMAVGLTFQNFSCIVNDTYKSHIIKNDQCYYKIDGTDQWLKCMKWNYDKSLIKSTFISDLDLVCDRQIYKMFIYPLFFFGSVLRLPFNMIADKFGRRYLYLGCFIISILSSIWMMFLNTIVELYISLILDGFTVFMLSSLTLANLVEVVPMRQLEIAGANFWLFFTIGYMCSSGFAFYSRSWRIMYGFSIMLSGFHVLYYWFIPETPRWLVIHGRKKEAYKVISFIGKINGKEISKDKFDQWNPIQEESNSYTDVFKSKILFMRMLIIGFVTFSFSMSYNAISTDLNFAIKDLFINILVMGLIEFPTGPLGAAMAKYLGRKMGSLTLTILGIVSLVIIPFLKSDLNISIWQTWLKLTLSMLAKLGITSAWCVYEVYKNEIVPTSIRNSSQYYTTLLATIAGGISPIIHEYLLKVHIAAPCILYAALLIVGMILMMLLLPETKDIPLVQTIKQAVSLKVGNEKKFRFGNINISSL